MSVPQPTSDKQPIHPQVLALLDSVAPVMRGVSYVHKHGGDRDCTFCLDPITAASLYVRVTPCRHVYHSECLEQWVMYTANAALDWRNYVIGDDGTVDVSASPPTCPNCTTRLPVLPAHLVRHALLTAIAHSLSLPNLAVAANMYDAGLLSRSPPLIVQYPQVRPVATSLVRTTSSLATESPTPTAATPPHPPHPPAPASNPSIHMQQQQQQHWPHTSPPTSSLPPLMHGTQLTTTSRHHLDSLVASTSSMALVTPPNVRMLERNALRAPVGHIETNDRHVSTTALRVLEAST